SAVRQTGNAALLFSIGDTQVDWRCNEAPRNEFLARRARQIYLDTFRLADEKQTGAVDLQALRGSPEFQFLRQVFPLADRDGDGRLTEKELLAFLDLEELGSRSSVVLIIADRGRGLFEYLDANRDGRLGQRELRTAWSRLAAWDRDG